MKVKIKKTLSGMLALTLALSVAGCNSGKKPNPSNSKESNVENSVASSVSKSDSEENVNLKFANYAILESGYTDFWNGVKSDFEEKNQGVTIEYVTAPYGEIVNTIINMAAAGNKIDLLFGENSWVPGLVDSGLASPIDEILSEEFLSSFYPSVLKDYEMDGKTYGIPMYISPFLLYYNKDILKEAGFDNPPQTYDEMLSMAEKISTLKTADGNKIYAFGQTTASVPVSGASLNALIFTMGGDLLDAQGKLSVDNEGFKEAFALLKTLEEKGYNPQNAKLKDLRNLFALGQLAMYYDQSWGFNGINSINENANNFIASAAPLKTATSKGESLLQAHSLILVNNGEASAKALDTFVQYLISNETLENYLQNVTPAYPATTTMESLKLNPALDGAKGSEANVKSQVQIPEISNLHLELASLAQSVTVNNMDVDQAIEQFKVKANEIVK